MNKNNKARHLPTFFSTINWFFFVTRGKKQKKIFTAWWISVEKSLHNKIKKQSAALHIQNMDS